MQPIKKAQWKHNEVQVRATFQEQSRRERQQQGRWKLKEDGNYKEKQRLAITQAVQLHAGGVLISDNSFMGPKEGKRNNCFSFWKIDHEGCGLNLNTGGEDKDNA